LFLYIYPAYTIDKYFKNKSLFNVLGEDIMIEDYCGIVEIIKKMKKIEREIILLYYVIGMTDESISKKMNQSHQEINKKRRKAEKNLREMVKREMERNEEY